MQFLGAVLLVAAVAACSVPVGGVAEPSGSPSAAPSSVAPTTEPKLGLPDVLLPPKVPLPPRPRDVSVAGRDPCAVLTPAFAESLGFDLGPGRNDFVLLNDAPGCTVSQNSHAEVLTIVFATTVGGIDIYNRANVFAADLQPLDVAGFPALAARPKAAGSFCYVVVDTAPGEFIVVQIGEGGRKPTTPLDRLCTSAKRVAVPVIEAVLAS